LITKERVRLEVEGGAVVAEEGEGLEAMVSWVLIMRMEAGTAVGAMLGVGVVGEGVVSVAVEEDGTMDLLLMHNKMEVVEEDGTMDLRLMHNKMEAVEEDGTMDLRLMLNKMEDTIVNRLFKAAAVAVGGEIVEGVVALDLMGRSRQQHEALSGLP